MSGNRGPGPLDPDGEGEDKFGYGDDGSPATPGRERWRLWDHIGVISGVFLGLVALGILLVIAAAGDPGAFGILVVIVVGVGLIYFGGQLHGSRSSRRGSRPGRSGTRR